MLACRMPEPHAAVRILTLLLLLACVEAPLAAPEWIVNAAHPGPDTPPAGESRFDQLFRGSDGRYRIPWPFENLIEFLEQRVDNGDEPAVRDVFVPIGRSLRRNDPAPDYFRFPRRVIALEGEPVTAEGSAGMVMEYRLFIAHQPSAGTLEVISYNDAAGRFEFQLIGNYVANGEALEKPARRVMCTSCHHNAAPIFARNPWSETSFNVEVASRLAAALPGRFDSMIEVLSLDAGVIDVLAGRANYLAAAQFFWQQGCTSVDCRAAMLRAALQYRLSGRVNFDRGRTDYRRDYVDALARNWKTRWPRGLALAGSRIDDRDPFSSAAAPDPLLPRPPQASWHEVDEALAAGIVFRLGSFFTAADIRRLDRRLIRLAGSDPPNLLRYRAECRAPDPDALPLVLVCGADGGPGELRAKLEFDDRSRGRQALRVVWLAVPRDPNLLQPAIVSAAISAERIEARFGDPETGLSQRLANGDRVVSMSLDREPSPAVSRLEIRVAPEFHWLESALQRLLAMPPRAAGKSLAGGVFDRESLLRPLMRELGMPPLDWIETAAARAKPPPRVSLRPGGGLALLEPYCAHCHAGDDSNPPGFLASAAPGDALARCAPRMLARLETWQRYAGSGRSPMPPPASIAFSGTNAARWPSSDHYRSLVSSLGELLEKEYGAPAAARFRQADYDSLPSCVAVFSE